MDSIHDHGSHDIKMVIVGHKADLHDERAVTTDEGKKVSSKFNDVQTLKKVHVQGVIFVQIIFYVCMMTTSWKKATTGCVLVKAGISLTSIHGKSSGWIILFREQVTIILKAGVLFWMTTVEYTNSQDTNPLMT